MPNHTTEQLLTWIGFDTDAKRNAVKDDLMPDGTGLSQLLKESPDGIEEVCAHYNKRNPANTRFYVSRVKIKHLQNVMYYVKDKDRLGLDAAFDDNVTEEEFFEELDGALEREIRRSEMKKTGKNLISAEFQVKLKGRSQWERWMNELTSTLGGIVGAVGVPLTYIIREKDEPTIEAPDDAEDEWDWLSVAATPLEGKKYIQDRKLVHQIIIRNVADDSDAYTYLKPNVAKENGRMDYKALSERYDSHSSKETRISEAKNSLIKLQYRNERSMSFERFSEKFQRAVDDLETGGRPMHNDDIIDALWPKILNNELSSFVMALKVDQARNPRNYKEILQEMATEVPKLSQAGSYRRTAAEIATGEKLEGKYTREGKCPSSGVMANGKIFIGNYTGKKWHDESVKPYHDKSEVQGMRILSLAMVVTVLIEVPIN